MADLVPTTACKPEAAPTERLRVLEGGASASSPGPSAPSTRILIVDDDPDDIFLIENSLLKASPELEVESIRDASCAVAAICSGRFDAALVDYRLGASDGLTLIARCRAAGARLPLILLTGQGGLEVDLEAMRKGATDYLCKAEMTPALLERSIRYAMERHAAARELVASQRRYEAAARGSNDGIWDWDAQVGELYLSDRFKSMLGFDHQEMMSTREDWFSRVHEDDLPELEEALADHLVGKIATLAIEYRMRHRDGSWRWVFLRGMSQYDQEGSLERVAGSQSDITVRKAAEAEVRRQALHDALTGLANRTLLQDRISHALHRVKRESGYGFALLCLDLDDFKPINDLHGHAAGDAVLASVAKRLRESVREVDTVARVGGDEFVVLLDRCHRKADVEMISDHIRSTVAASIDIAGVAVSVGVSIGHRLVNESDREKSAPELLDDADRSMYGAKMAQRCRDPIRMGAKARRE